MDGQRCVLVAANDSEPAFEAVGVAVGLARDRGLALRVVSVVEPWEHAAPSAFVTDEASHRVAQEAGAAAACRYATQRGERAGVPVTCTVREGTVGAQVLAEADACRAELVVMARVSRPGHALPSVGSQTLRVIEFATVPVLVVPTFVGRGPRLGP